MKTLLLPLIILFTTLPAFSQKIKVNEKSEKIGGGNNNALIVTIYDADKRQVEKAWKNEMKNFGAKVSSRKEIFADDAKWHSIGDNTFDVYAKVVDVGRDALELIVAVDMGGTFMSSGQHGSQSRAMKDLVNDFAVKMTREGLNEKIEDAGKQLKKLEKDQENLVKDNEKLHNDIADYEKRIEKAKSDIEQNKKDQENKKKEIADQAEAVKALEGKLRDVN